MAKNLVEIQILVDAVKGTRSFKLIGKSASAAGKAIKAGFAGAGGIFNKLSAGAKKADASLQKIGQQMAGAQAAFSAFSGVADLAKLGAMSERVERRFGAFAKEAGGATVILEAFQKGAGGTVDKMGAMSTASRLLQMGLVGSAGEMENVVEIATRLGDQTQGATDRISDFSLLLANQSIPRLDNFGISSGKVRARIQELQAATPGLSRETAFMAATMEQAELSLTKLGPRVDDNAAKFERLEAKMADTKVEIGQKLAPAIAELFSLFSDLLNIASPLIDIFSNLVGTVSNLVGGFTDLAGIDLSGVFDPKGAAKTAEMIATMGDSAEIAEGTISEWTTTATEMLSTGNSVAGVMSVLGKRVGETSEAFEAGGKLADIFVDQTGIIGEAVEAANTIISQNTTTWDEYRAAVEAWNTTATDSNAQIELVSESTFNLNRMMQLQREEMELAAESMAVLSERTVEAEVGTTDFAVSQEMAELALLNAGRAAEKYETALAEQAKAQKALEETSIAEEQQLAARALSSANAAAREYESALQAQVVASEASVAAAEAAATALAAQAEQAQAAAVSQTNLAASLLDATQAQVAQALISQLDVEALGAEGFTTAVTGIQIAFGLADEKSIALASNVSALADAINAGIVPVEGSAQALETMIFQTERGITESDSLIQSMEGLAPPIEAVTSNTAALTVEMSTMGVQVVEVDALLTTGAGSLRDFGSDATTTTGDVLDLAKAADALQQDLFALTSTPHIISVQIETTGTLPGPGGGLPQFQGGGIVPGPIGAPVPIIAHGGETVLPVGGGSATNNFLTINTTQAPSIPLEFQTMSAFASA